jgi:NADH:ubiquinone oxidoreductase subunit 5 (subunit L)/multisubunit Na+/H+ antiporter MnhA subunit
MLYHSYNYFFLGLVTKIKLADLFAIQNILVALDLNIDLISFSFAFLTVSIGLFTVIYAYSYFRSEPFVIRLLIYINIFIYGMLLLVFADNIIIMLLG